MSFDRSCRRGPARLGLFLAVAALGAPAAAQLARNPGEGGADGDERHERDDPAGRAEWNAMLRRDRDGRVLAENRLKALDATCQMPVDSSMAQAPAGSFTRSAVGPSVRSSYTTSGTAWQSLGPQPMQSFVSGRRNWGVVAGRVDAIVIHPTNPNVMLLGAATGGIWKSTDGGASWRPVADTAPALAISNIAFSSAACSSPPTVATRGFAWTPTSRPMQCSRASCRIRPTLTSSLSGCTSPRMSRGTDPSSVACFVLPTAALRLHARSNTRFRTWPWIRIRLTGCIWPPVGAGAAARAGSTVRRTLARAGTPLTPMTPERSSATRSSGLAGPTLRWFTHHSSTRATCI